MKIDINWKINNIKIRININSCFDYYINVNINYGNVSFRQFFLQIYTCGELL